MDDFYAHNYEYQTPLPPVPGNCLFEKFFYSLSKQEVATGHHTTAPAKGCSFHPSVFSSGVHENIMEPDTSHGDDENYHSQLEETPSPVENPLSNVSDNSGASRSNEEKRPQEVILCPFHGCDFHHIVDYTKETLEGPGSWKTHIFTVHWPQGGRNWEVCRWDGCGLPQANRSSAWKHLAVHVEKFHVKCPREGCRAYFSRGDRIAQHIREIHQRKRR